MKELNKKLLEFAGFKFFKVTDVISFFTGGIVGQKELWEYPDGTFDEPPNLLESLDDCFKWLVPKVLIWLMGHRTLDRISAIKYLFKMWLKEGPVNPTALSLCLAIEKLIDSEGISGKAKK